MTQLSCPMSRRAALVTCLAVPAMPVLIASTAAADLDAPAPLGIILVGASWCPWCHGAARQLHLASQQWGWPVIVASLDNRPIPPFEDYIPSADHPLTADIARLPTTLIVAPANDQIVVAFEGYKGPVPYLSRIADAMAAPPEAISHG